MRKILIFIFLFFCVNLYSEDLNNKKTIFDSKMIKAHGFMYARGYKHSTFNKKNGFLYFDRLAWIVNHNYIISIENNSLITDLNIKDTNSKDIELEYHGLKIDIIKNSTKKIHSNLCFLIGGGAIEFENSEGGDDIFFIFVPSYSYTVNLAQYLRFSVNLGYRVITGLKFDTMKDRDLDGVEFGFEFKVGKF